MFSYLEPEWKALHGRLETCGTAQSTIPPLLCLTRHPGTPAVPAQTGNYSPRLRDPRAARLNIPAGAAVPSPLVPVGAGQWDPVPLPTRTQPQPTTHLLLRTLGTAPDLRQGGGGAHCRLCACIAQSPGMR